MADTRYSQLERQAKASNNDKDFLDLIPQASRYNELESIAEIIGERYKRQWTKTQEPNEELQTGLRTIYHTAKEQNNLQAQKIAIAGIGFVNRDDVGVKEFIEGTNVKEPDYDNPIKFSDDYLIKIIPCKETVERLGIDKYDLELKALENNPGLELVANYINHLSEKPKDLYLNVNNVFFTGDEADDITDTLIHVKTGRLADICNVHNTRAIIYGEVNYVSSIVDSDIAIKIPESQGYNLDQIGYNSRDTTFNVIQDDYKDIPELSLSHQNCKLFVNGVQYFDDIYEEHIHALNGDNNEEVNA